MSAGSLGAYLRDRFPRKPGAHLSPRIAAPALFALAALFVAPANAELTQQAGLLVSFSGRLVPSTLPRSVEAPVTVDLGGNIRSVEGAPFPQLRRIEIAINRHGRLHFDRLPVCPLARIEHSGVAHALGACRRSLVGRGRFGALIALPEQGAFRTAGRLYAFNSRYRGRPAILAHLFTRRPTSIAVTVPLLAARGSGTYGTVLRSPPLPDLLGHHVYATQFRFQLGARSAARPTYLSASCPAPPGVSIALFPLARATFGFDDGRTVRQTISRACRVRP